MKKYFTVAFLLLTSTLLSACSGDKTKVSNDVAKVTTITATPTETFSKTNFTEGVWIKKYPDNYASFKFETPDGFQVVSDPFLVNEELQPDIVTESHQDMDHNDTSNLEEPYRLLMKPEEYKKGSTIITGYAGKHNKGDIEGTNNIFVIKMNGITIAHFASQGELPSNEVLHKIGKVDILLIQIFNTAAANKLLPEDADVIIRALNPKIVIPEHGDPDMCKILSEHLQVKEEIQSSGNVIITRSMLDKIDGIRVFNLDTVIHNNFN
jgi:Predicted Zn-dependent hydrolases of the beta-lactamase fold